MTRTPFDTFSKQFLEEFLAPLGQVKTSHEVPGESRFVDIYFIPAPQPSIDPNTLGLLGRIAATSCLIEPFRNPPTLTEVRNCLLKLFLVQADVQRQAKREEQRSLVEAELPQLWILAPSASESLLQGFGAKSSEEWLPGVYCLSQALKTAIVAINQLPQTEETLWLRILGRGTTQQQAITELLALPADYPRRESVLELLMSWKVSLEVTGQFQREEQNLMVELSQAYLEWKQQTEQQGAIQEARSLVLRLLTRRVGELPESVRSQIETLNLAQLEALGEALLDFANLSDLEAWLARQE